MVRSQSWEEIQQIQGCYFPPNLYVHVDWAPLALPQFGSVMAVQAEKRCQGRG